MCVISALGSVLQPLLVPLLPEEAAVWHGLLQHTPVQTAAELLQKLNGNVHYSAPGEKRSRRETKALSDKG